MTVVASVAGVDDDPTHLDAVAEFLRRSGAEPDVLHRPVDDGRLVAARYGGHTFFVWRLNRLGA